MSSSETFRLAPKTLGLARLAHILCLCWTTDRRRLRGALHIFTVSP